MKSAPNLPPRAELPRLLGHVRWIGGGSGAGKSTLAEKLARHHGAFHFATDDVMQDHVDRCLPDLAPNASAFMQMDMDERWLNRSPKTMLDSFHWFKGEGFDFIIEDLLALPSDKPVIAEGFRLLPKRVKPLLSSARNAVWLLPTPDFRERAFDARGRIWDIPRQTSDPGRALANLLTRDAMFTERLIQEVGEMGLEGIVVDGTETEDETYGHLKKRFFD